MFLLQFLLTSLWAQQIAIPALTVSPQDFEQHLKHHPQQISYIQYHHQKSKGASKSLLQELKSAQYHYLDGQVEEAKKLFQNISERRWERDWGDNERQSLHFSMLRVAQLSTNQDEKRKWLKKALHFAPKQNIDNNIFPPPLVQSYLKLKSQLKKQVWPLPKGAEHFDQVLVNGEVIDHSQSFIRMASRPVRLSFLSNRYPPQVFTGPIKQQVDKKLDLTPWAQGRCQQSKWHDSLNAKKISLVRVEPNCQLALAQKRKPLIVPKPHYKSKTSRQEASTPLWKSKWLWAGVSVVATGLILHQRHQQQGRGDTPPPEPEVSIFTNANH